MKERPILFSGAMVRALLAGTKTQTRRVVKPAPQTVTDRSIKPWDGDADALLGLLTKAGKNCPYGQPSDRLWVRECWTNNKVVPIEHRPPGDFIYRADLNESGVTRWAATWKPSIHMPRAASRITLEVTGVRVERLQGISEADAIAEGVAYDPGEGGTFHVPGMGGCASDSAAGAFRKLWEQINGAESWAANPWAWVVEFKRLEGK